LRQRFAGTLGKRKVFSLLKGAGRMATTGTTTLRRINANRRISTVADAPTPADGYLTRIVKYVPTEFITIFLTLNNFVGDGYNDKSDKLSMNQYWVVFGALLVANAIYLYFATRQSGKSPATTQVIISTLLYAVFIYAVGGPFKEANHYSATLATILLPVALLVAGLIVPNPIPVKLDASA
jgi:hypothetical protein